MIRLQNTGDLPSKQFCLASCSCCTAYLSAVYFDVICNSDQNTSSERLKSFASALPFHYRRRNITRPKSRNRKEKKSNTVGGSLAVQKNEKTHSLWRPCTIKHLNIISNEICQDHRIKIQVLKSFAS
ncbi:hypothetical protein BRADI_5g15734v3 [Brachypodium distachyon]|uniref:Uncharacterized protein n=1 Tax=Brachypodium distachyon TaxID=15368 RepID=A0A0Q3EB60_BRADI|nr:hypothetical protein BRADI_5g15734v3 [Brachypodium distachyon]